MNSTVSSNQFIESEIAVWGYDYIFDLLDRGYTPVLVFGKDGIASDTCYKWTWQLPKVPTKVGIDKVGSSCYNGNGDDKPLNSRLRVSFV